MKYPAIASLLVAVTAVAGTSISPATKTSSNFKTLYAQDPLRHTVSLHTGAYGTKIEDHTVFNVDSELDFGVYGLRSLTAGIQGGQVGQIVDLGTWQDLANRYGYQETVGGGQGFASIHFEGTRLVILKDYATKTFQHFTEGNQLLTSPTPVSSASVRATPGHVYLVKIVDNFDPGFLRLAKLMVVSRRGNDEVALMWEEL